MRGIARWCFRKRRIVVAAWVVSLIVVSAIAQSVGSNYSDSFRLKGTESTDAISLLQRSAPRAAGDTDRVVIAARTGKVTDPAVRAKAQQTFDRLAALPHVAAVLSPFSPGAERQVSRDGRIAYATVNLDKQASEVPPAATKRVIATAQAAAGLDLQVELGGLAIERAAPRAETGTLFGFLAAAIVLFLVFRSFLAMALPLLSAALSLGVGVSVIGLLSHLINMASFSSQLALLIGLGVGVDYALFVVSRYRQALMRGRESEPAAVEALDTSGRAVLFAGMTVCIALLGMFALGVSFLYGVAIAASIVVAFTVLAALTLMPALLGFFGPRLLSRPQRRAVIGRELTSDDESPFWGRWARILLRRPALLATLAALVMLLIAVPFLSLRLGSSDQGSNPTDTTTRKAYDLLAKGFGPGFNGPLQLVAVVGGAGEPDTFARVVAAAGRAPNVAAVSQPRVLPSAGGAPPVAVASVVPRGSPQDASTTALVHDLRDRVIPGAAGGQPRVLVGGSTAIFNDFASVLAGKLPLFVGVVVLLSFLLLMAVFRSIVIPAMAAVMNLLAVGAAFGVVTAVFQWGWLASLIGVTRTGPIEAFLPVMVFAILFGLSMDYEVFLVSRIYEEWHQRRDNREAVVRGLAATGRTITAAAAIMVLVFAAFVLGGERVIKLFGVGLASAVLLDAVVIRSILVPGLMLVLGERNWYLPKGLDRMLPRLNVEGAPVDDRPDDDGRQPGRPVGARPLEET
jgi:RND superfamily putative drug exporter